MAAEVKARHETKINREVSQAEIDEALNETVEQKVTPLSHLSYEDQLTKKHEMLRGILDSFTNTLNNDIRRKNEVAPIWFQK